MTETEAVAQFWAAFVAETRAAGPYTSWGFGDSSRPELMTKLGLLVRDGPKRATTGLEAEYEDDGDPLPRVGDHAVILDGLDRPLCIIRTTWVDVMPFGEVDAAFAWDEGEGDRSLAEWRAIHERYFAGIGRPVTDESRVVLERFAKVWPPPTDS